MTEGIKNYLRINCEGVDLTTVSNIEFYLKQGRFFRQYTPEVLRENEMLVEVPFEDAKKLMATDVQLQFAYTDAQGTPRATGVVTIPVEVLLKEAGYDPV